MNNIKKINILIIILLIIAGSVFYGPMKKYKVLKEEQNKQERITKNMPEVESLIERVKMLKHWMRK